MAQPLILVVDDEKDIVDIICELLQGDGFTTISANDGKQALDQLTKKRPSLIVLDIKMPVLDGLEVIRRMRSDPKLKRTPVVVLTATQVIHEAKEQFQQFGVAKWIAKPFEPNDLLDAVHKALEGGG